MNKIRLIVLLQWFVVYSYGKYGYSATGEAAEHFGRFFNISNQLLLTALVYMVAKYKISKADLYSVLAFNGLLAVLFAQHYLLPKSYYNVQYRIYETIIAHYPNGFYIPCMSFIVFTLLLNFLINFREK